MAFKMTKPTIHGSKEHSALLAKAEEVRTHGADPAITDIAKSYGESNSPDLIDWKLTWDKIDMEKKEKEEEENGNGEQVTPPSSTTTTTTPVPPTPVPPPAPAPNTPEHKEIVAEEEKNIAIDKLRVVPIVPKALVDVEGSATGPDITLRTPPEPSKVLLAHNDPKYEIAGPKYDTEGQLISMGGTTTTPGYNYDSNLGWTYNGFSIAPQVVPKEHRESQEKQEKEVQTQTQTQPTVEEEAKIEEKKTPKKTTRRPREHEYKWGTASTPGGWKSGGKEAYEKALAEWRAQNK